MDNLSELDDCINTLEQLQLTLDFETSTVKRNPKTSTSPLSPRFMSVNRIDVVHPNQISLNQVTYDQHLPDLTKSSVTRRIDKQTAVCNQSACPSSPPEMLDLKSVSVRRPKLMSNMSIDNDLFSVPECDTTDFPPPPPPINVDTDNYLKTYSTLQSPRSTSTNSSPSPNKNAPFQTVVRKQSTTSLKLSVKPLVDPFSNTKGNINHLQSSSHSNIASFSEKEPTSLNSFRGADTISVQGDPSKQTVVRFFTTDKTTKAIVVTEGMTVEQVIKMLMEKHFWIPSLKSTIVEKVPSLKMERFFEEHEFLLNCINSWPSTCGNMIFFEPREEIYGLFENSKVYLGENYPPGAINVDAIKDLFITLTSEQHEYQDYLYIKKPGENSWKRKFCLLNHHGIFSIQKRKSKCMSPNTVMSFTDQFYLYTSTGGWTKQWDAPTPFGFAFKPYSVVDHKSDQILMFCAGDEVSMKRWCSNLRLCKYKNQILNNYQHMQNRSIYCSNLYSSDNQINRFLSQSPSISNKNVKYNFSNRSSLPTSNLNFGKVNPNKFKF